MKLAYGVAEAAELCQISERQMRRLISEGVIHARRFDDKDNPRAEVRVERYTRGRTEL